MAEERFAASFSIDVTALRAGLTQANRLIRESNSEFKAAAAGMDDWTKSEAGLNAKLTNLNDVAGIQQKKIDALKQEYLNAGYAQDDLSAAAIKLRTDINNEQAALEKTKSEITKYSKALDEARNNAVEAGDDAEKAGKQAKQSGDDAEKGGSGWSKFGNVAKAAAAAAAAAMAAAGAAIVGVTKQALESYASYEQLVGGVDTLFGKSSQKVQDYAANAYKTAGMSANEYMETVTGFSASLLQSLGGDTEKAAEYADMAIRDMSDNANKMGTDMESIQNAYGGFAKQNYTMLDNLKLGYGGTQEEMQRLLDDASKISGIEYDISSYGDIVDAIHIVQDEMGITGTTAKEASSTIEGSLSATKSAYSNLMTGLADDNADMDLLINNLIDSALTAADNLLPRISIILEAIPKAIGKILPEIPPIIETLLPQLISAIMTLLDGIVAVLPTIVETIMQVVPQLLTALVGMLPTLLTTIIDIVLQVINALSAMLPEIVAAIMEVLPTLINSLISAIPQLLQAAITLLLAIIDAVPYIITALVKAIPSIVSTVISTLLANMPLLLKAAIQLFLALVKAIPQIQLELAKTVPSIIVGIVKGIIDGVPKMFNAGVDLIKGLWNGIKDMKDWIINKVKNFGGDIIGGLKDFFGIHSPSKLMENTIGKNLALGIGTGFEKSIGAVNDEITSAMSFDDVNINAKGVKGRGVTVYQTNNYSQAHSRYELYKSKQETAAAVRLALGSA